MPKKRYFPNGEYDSKFEKEMDVKLKPLGWKFHGRNISYHILHTYTPDWVKVIDEKKTLYIEGKAIFRDSSEAAKYKWIKEAIEKNNKENLRQDELVFLFQEPAKELWFRAKRKNGTRLTNGEWAKLNGFKYYTVEDFK